jgi:hypothetical protein
MRAPLDNQDRGLDPTVNADLRPLNHVKVEAIWNGSTYPLFRGFIRSYPQDWPARTDAVSTIEAEDAFSLMARYELEDQAIAEQSAGDHISDVLTLFGWPAAGEIPPGAGWWQLGTAGKSELGTTTRLGENLRFLDEGRSTIMALTATGNMLEHLLNVAENTDRGTLYMGPGGDLVFEQKPTPHAPVIGTWGDGEGEYDYFDFRVSFDDQQWYNDVRVTRRGDSTEYVAKDATSVADDGPRTLPISDTLFSTAGAAQNLATELLGSFGEPVIYPVQLVMRPRANSTIWSLILGMPLMSKITVNRRPPGGGDVISLDTHVIGITYSIGQFWEITWDLAATETLLEAWYLGTPGFSELGTTTILG